MKKILISLFVIIVIFGLAYWRAVANKPQIAGGESYYEKTRAQLLEIVNAEEFDNQAFREFLNTLPPYRLDRWPQEFWRSITFVDPRGDITVYQDVMMGVALGVHRLWQQEEPQFDVENKVIEIINRRASVWHDFRWQNHYTREYAALASLAQVIGDVRFSQYQKKLHQSLALIFSADGSSSEGPYYGFYTAKLLAPYVYLTNDSVVKEYLDDFYQWSAQVSAAAGWLPPFDNSRLIKLPNPASYFSIVNTVQNYGSYLNTIENYQGENETVYKEAKINVWIRHQPKLQGKTYHQHYSSGDVLMKSANYWWLIPPGYDHTQDLNRPYLHNIASVKDRRSIWWWKLLSYFGKDFSTALVSREGQVVQLKLNDGISREVAVGDDALLVKDSLRVKPFNVYWHIMGEVVEKNITEPEAKIIFKQGSEYLLASFQGFATLTVGTAPHALIGKIQQDHNFIHLTGQEITSEFLVQ